MSDAKRLLVPTIALLAALTPSRAWAFKIETHVWIAQQLLNDLATCRDPDRPSARCVTIALTDPVTRVTTLKKLAVDNGLAESILAHAGQFRMGTVGPDGFPDLVGGQMTAHPGISDTPDTPNGWQ